MEKLKHLKKILVLLILSIFVLGFISQTGEDNYLFKGKKDGKEVKFTSLDSIYLSSIFIEESKNIEDPFILKELKESPLLKSNTSKEVKSISYTEPEKIYKNRSFSDLVEAYKSPSEKNLEAIREWSKDMAELGYEAIKPYLGNRKYFDPRLKSTLKRDLHLFYLMKAKDTRFSVGEMVAQYYQESHLGTKGKGAKHNNPFNLQHRKWMDNYGAKKILMHDNCIYKKTHIPGSDKCAGIYLHAPNKWTGVILYTKVIQGKKYTKRYKRFIGRKNLSEKERALAWTKIVKPFASDKKYSSNLEQRIKKLHLWELDEVIYQNKKLY